MEVSWKLCVQKTTTESIISCTRSTSFSKRMTPWTMWMKCMDKNKKLRNGQKSFSGLWKIFVKQVCYEAALQSFERTHCSERKGRDVLVNSLLLWWCVNGFAWVSLRNISFFCVCRSVLGQRQSTLTQKQVQPLSYLPVHFQQRCFDCLRFICCCSKNGNIWQKKVESLSGAFGQSCI